MSAIPSGAWVITGAGSGFGRELALRLAERGASLALWDLNLEGLEQTAQELESLGQSAILIQVDVSDAHAVEHAVEQTKAALGSISHLACSAGVLRVGPAIAMSSEDHALMMRVNYLGSVNVARAWLPELVRSSERSVLMFIASVAGLRGFPQLAGYSASKFAVVGYAQALRDELADTSVDVRVLCPPPGDTPMVRNLEQLPPVYRLSKMYSAEQVVSAALRGLEGRSPLLFVDVPSRAVQALNALVPRLVDFVIQKVS